MSGKEEGLRDGDGIAASHGCPQAADAKPLPQRRERPRIRILRCGKAAPELEAAHSSYVILSLNLIDLIVISASPHAPVWLILQRNMIRSLNPQRSRSCATRCPAAD